MRFGVSFSVAFHAVLMVIAYYGLPSLRRDVMMEAPVMVEIVTVSEKTNAPAPKAKPKKQAKVEKPKPKPKPAPPKKQVKAAAEPVAPPPPPEPKPEEVAVLVPAPEAKPKAKEKPKPKPKPKPEVKQKPKPSKALARLKPKRKPKPPDAFASVLKTVADLKSQPAPAEKPKEKKKEKAKKPEPSFEDQIAKALVSKKRRYDSSQPLSLSEIDYVRQQIAKCWNLPAGAKEAENMVIEIAVDMNMDGTVRSAKVNTVGLQSDPFLRAMSESALRAVLNRRCQPFRLPGDKYDRWKTMTLIFNPKEMLGT